MGRVSARTGVAFGFLQTAVAAALLYVLTACSNHPGDLKSLTHGAMAKLNVSVSPPAAPDTVFHDAAGAPHTLADFKGKVVVLNLWANWCAPCKEEIPSLATLQTEFAGQPVVVVPVSIGKDRDEVLGKAFIARNPPLPFYTEPTANFPFAFKPPVEGMPTTVLFDRRGVERARLSGGADWSGKDARAVIRALLEQK